MNTTLSFSSSIAQFAADDRWHGGGPPWGGGPGPFLLFPILFWTAVILLVVLGRRRFAGRAGEGTLRDAFARGEVDEAQYRERLAVLRQTRR